MAKQRIDLKISQDTEDGDCYIKCLYEICKELKIPLSTSKLIALMGGLLLEDDGVELGKVCYVQEAELIEDTVFLIKEKQYNNLEEGLVEIKKELLNNRLLIIPVNVYYICYTDDYLKNSGGFFHGPHYLILHGFDDGKKVFIISDPVFKKESYEIDYDVFSLAWTYTKDAGRFVPLLAGVYGKKDNVDYASLLKKTLKESIKGYFVPEADQNEEHTWEQVYCINTLITQLDHYMGKSFFHDKKQFLLNLNYSIFFYMRWVRKSMGYFLASDEFKEYEGLAEYKEFFLKKFDEWTLVSNLLAIGVDKENDKRICKARDKMIMLVEEEVECYSKMMQIVCR